MSQSNPVKFVDSQAPFDMVAKNGYYQVGDIYFNHKVNALVQATRTNQSVKWHFNDDIWKKFDWRHDDALSLTYWYGERAKQLREKYDYLILSFSGGRDSHNILHSFIDNGIHIDEVWCDWPLTHTHGKFDLNSQDTTPKNMPSEWTFAIKPELEKLKLNFPKVKITITDSTQPLDEEYAEDSLIVSQYAFYATIKRWRTLDEIIKKRTVKYDRVAAIIGIDKPNYMIINDYLSMCFMDTTMQIKTDVIDGCIRNIEYFYWAKDLPELVRSQAHAILNYLRTHTEDLKYQLYGKINFDNTVIQSSKIDLYQATQLQDMINHVVYSKYDNSRLQVKKPKNVLYNCEWYSWLTNDNNHKALQSHRSALDNTFKLINNAFFQQDSFGNILNYQGIGTKFFPVGKI